MRGRERPDEIVVVSCHFDSWDVGTGASDDAGGCVAAWEAARLLKQLDLRPRRTVRVVLYTNEENGLRGGLDYRTRYQASLDRHVLMIESDLGVARTVGIRLQRQRHGARAGAAVASLLGPIGATHVGPSGGGADIGPSVAAARIPSMSPEVDSTKYFGVHHTEADTVDRIDPTDLSRHVAALAVMTYVVADMPARLGEAASCHHDQTGRTSSAVSSCPSGHRLTSSRQDDAAALAGADAHPPVALAPPTEDHLVAVIEERARLAGRERDRLLAAPGQLQQTPRDSRVGPDTVPLASRSPGRRLQPLLRDAPVAARRPVQVPQAVRARRQTARSSRPRMRSLDRLTSRRRSRPPRSR